MSIRWTVARGSVAGLLVVILFLAGTATMPLLDRDEPRFAEATREMRERGDLVVPTFNGSPRYDKPPLIYWMQWASLACLGESEVAVRLPSVLCTALSAMLLVLWGRRAAGDDAGWMAGAVFATTLQVAVHGRMAAADMALVLFVTATSWAAWEMDRSERPSPAWWWIFWGGLGLGFLAKGPVAWIPVLVLGLKRPPDDARTQRSLWALLGGAAFTLAIIAVWGVPALIGTRGEFLRIGLGRHVIERSLGNLDGHGAGSVAAYLLRLPFFALTLWPSFFPWSIWLPWLVARRVRTVQPDLLVRQCSRGAVATFVVFTLSNTKLPHYLLPAFPWLSIWLAAEWHRAGRPVARWQRTAVVAGIATAVIVMVGARAVRERSLSPRLLDGIGTWPADTELAAVGYQEPSLVWYARTRLRKQVRFIDAEEASRFLASEGPRACVLPIAEFQRWESGRSRAPAPPAEIRPVTGWNLVHGRRVDLVLVRYER